MAGQVQRLATWRDPLSAAAVEGDPTGSAPGQPSGQIPGRMGSSCDPGAAPAAPVSSAGRKWWNLSEGPNPRIAAAPDRRSTATCPTKKALKHITKNNKHLVEKQPRHETDVYATYAQSTK